MSSQRTVIALHSLFFDGTMFDSLDLGDVTLEAPTFRGQGGVPTRGLVPSLRQLADDIIETARGMHCGPIDLIGSSMGAYVAILAVALAPKLFRSCVLSAASADAESRPELFYELEEKIRSVDNESLERLLSQTMFGETFRSIPSAPLRRWQEHFKQLDRSVADAAHEVFTREPLWEALSDVTVPLLLIAGDEDKTKGPDEMARIALNKPGSIFVTIQMSGHTPPVEQPDTLSRIIRHWWYYLDESIK